MKSLIEQNVNLYFEQKNSYLVTEIMKLYLNVGSVENFDAKIKCLELLSKIGG